MSEQLTLEFLLETKVVDKAPHMLAAYRSLRDTGVPCISTSASGENVAVVPLEVFEALLSGYTKNDLYDLRLLGNSEQYAQKKEMNSKLKDSLLEQALKDMSSKPYKYATHCLKVDPKRIFMNYKGNLYFHIDSQWQLAEILPSLLEEITTQYHPWLSEDPREQTVDHATVQSWTSLYLNTGEDNLRNIYIDEANSNSLGAIPSLNAMQVVAYHYDFKL